MLFLNNKQIAQLLVPFLIVGTVFFFDDTILNLIHEQFPGDKKTTDIKFNKEAQMYLNIGRERDKYDKIEMKREKAKQYASWITKSLLYSVEANRYTKLDNGSRKVLWSLEAVFPKNKMAIINSKFVHEGSIVHNAKVIQIKFDSILLKTKKGLQWVHLFH